MKFRRLDYLGQRLGALATAALPRPALFEDPGGSANGGLDVVTWVPLHWRRRLARGFDQAEEVARGVARALDLPCRRLLRRRRATPPQSRADRRERLANLRGAFAAVAPDLLRGGRPRILLVDDVMTTGATLEAATRALRAAGSGRPQALALARTPDGEPGTTVAAPPDLP